MQVPSVIGCIVMAVFCRKRGPLAIPCVPAKVPAQPREPAMLIVTGEIEIDPADVETVRAAAIVMMDETGKEAGCRFYRFYQDLGHPGKIRVYEEWESQAHLDAHMATPHMADWRRALSGVTVKSRRIHVLTGASVHDL
jgi:quinol monooxygenase YgiN